ncbi:hypothetical protein TCAL_09316 [Tigriopus californicus]|uniref:Galactosylgalactosylxylosylprotein 3-beta-glucuronosyltransferase n=1 Tax=Tigriopus californicus TaxID=6832 RepID=A0A553PKD4_TIGCA|nr:galactosylgalactosylxylosylprotein 3-beta-glucuronosyltransferase P-like [Tigriopus californicus]TRY78142.1 hypothetical protein TCAL_09316 [Tigriopus californicus]
MIPSKNNEKTSPSYDNLFVQMCNDSLPHLGYKLDKTKPVLYIVTPTFARREQVAELTRLAQTLLHVRNMIWFVIEDATKCSPMVGDLLDRFQIPYVQMLAPLPEIFSGQSQKPRGVSQRNAAIQFILSQSNPPEGVLYFADDDNTYDLRLFEDIRTTKKISMFPVGLVAGSSHSSPILKDGRLVGYSDPWFGKRKFPMDMAGFAINIRMLTYNPDRVAMPFMPGYEEDGFLKGLNFNWEDVEALAENCTKVWVWHTTTIEKSAPTFRFEQSDTNLQSLFQELKHTGLIKQSDDGPHLPQCGIDKYC